MTRRARGRLLPAALIGLVLLAAVALAAMTRTAARGLLNPDSYEPDGSRAVVSVLRQQGVEVTPTTTLADTVDALESSPGTGVVIATPGLLSRAMTSQLLDAAPGRVTLVGSSPGEPILDRLAAGVDAAPRAEEALDPSCAAPYARAAGTAAFDSAIGYDARGWASRGTSCYGSPESAVVVDIAPTGSRPAVTLLGSPDPLRNATVTQEGNAALALNLIGRDAAVVWWNPSSTDPALVADSVPLGSLIPGWFWPLMLQVVFGVALIVGWRIRRMGRVVTERLPVVVRGSETAEGRARLLHRGDARDVAAGFSRRRAIEELSLRLGVAPGSVDELVDRVCELTGRSPESIRQLLLGPEPATDLALVDLVEELRRITKRNP